VEVTLRLGVDPSMQTRWCAAPWYCRMSWKKQMVLVIATARSSASRSGWSRLCRGEEMVEKIQKKNWTDFDALIATPDVMKSVGKWKGARPEGLDAQPEEPGTVTFDVANAIKEIKAGKVEFPHRQDRAGPRSRGERFLLRGQTVWQRHHHHHERGERQKPSAAKGKYIIERVHFVLNGPGIALDTAAVELAAKVRE